MPRFAPRPFRDVFGLFLAALPAVLAACTRGDAAPPPVAQVDTLPSGVIRVTSGQPTGWADSSRAWQLVEVARVDPADGSAGELVEPGSIGVDGAGRIYVVDQKPAVIKVFDSTGTFLRTIGREGSGPGEFRVGYLAVTADRIVLHDPMQSRTSVFDTSGTFLTSWVSSCCYWTDISVDRAERAYIPANIRRTEGDRDRGMPYLRYRLDGTPIDTVWVPRRDDDTKSWQFSRKGADGKVTGMMSTTVPFTPRLTSTFHPDGGFVLGWSGEYRLVRSETGADTTALYERAWTPDPIPEAVREARVEAMVKKHRQHGHRGHRPVADRAAGGHPDDGARLHPARRGPGRATSTPAILLVMADSTRPSYDLFSPQGARLGEIRFPVRVEDYAGMPGRESVYTVSTDEDGPLPIVVHLALRR
ncbi:MAG: 6-bladed beta-propeller [Gemmatimonadales bacterium]